MDWKVQLAVVLWGGVCVTPPTAQAQAAQVQATQAAQAQPAPAQAAQAPVAPIQAPQAQAPQAQAGPAQLASDGDGAFVRCMKYVNALEQLNQTFLRQETNLEKIQASIDQLQSQLDQSDQRLKSLIDQKVYANLNKLKADVTNQTLFTQVRNAQASSGGAVNLQVSNHQMLNARAMLGLQSDLLTHHMQTLDGAGRIALEQRLGLVQQLKSLLDEQSQLQVERQRLFDSYWELSDLAGEKSDLEWQAAMRALERGHDDNPGAEFMRAMLLMRTGKLDEAAQKLLELKFDPQLEAVLQCARAELYVRQGKLHEANQRLRSALSLAKNDPRIRLHRAVIYGLLKKPREAELEWQQTLKLGKYEIASRRAMAQLDLANNKPTEQQKTRALQYAQLAYRMSGDQDWMSGLTLAIAQAANAQPDAALASAEQAARHALGNHRQRCFEVLDKLKAGEPVTWSF